MITDRRRQIFRFLFLIVLTHILVGAQTSIWPHLMGTVSPPSFWLMIVVYLALYREVVEGVISLFFVSFSLSVYTSLPEGLLTLNLLALFWTVRFIKSRVFIPTQVYFSVIAGISVILFSILHFILSQIFDSDPTRDFAFFGTVAQTILTLIFSSPVFGLLRGMDYWLRDETKENWGER